MPPYRQQVSHDQLKDMADNSERKSEMNHVLHSMQENKNKKLVTTRKDEYVSNLLSHSLLLVKQESR